MRLRKLDLTRYGKFTDHSLDFGAALGGSPDLHVVYGLNEAGKSTAFAAYLDFLFGIEERSRFNFLHPYPAMQIGASVEFDGTEHKLVRVGHSVAPLLEKHKRMSSREVNKSNDTACLHRLSNNPSHMRLCV